MVQDCFDPSSLSEATFKILILNLLKGKKHTADRKRLRRKYSTIEKPS